MDDAEPQPFELDYETLRQPRAHVRLVDVAANRVDGCEGLQLAEEAQGSEITRVHDCVRCAQELEASFGQPSCTARQVRVSEHGDHCA